MGLVRLAPGRDAVTASDMYNYECSLASACPIGWRRAPFLGFEDRYLVL